ncbi:hypothetical protein [Desulfonatronovibrio hydrogenovorans]|uniref:hypothetical protein n=1 Tax=Desulfonatronovibrio hydrogenovorans TaxID=53245 RepID=UPI00048E2F96|nr:hypothetical protein [Desulfonatronovibrio hydrogenovorans]
MILARLNFLLWTPLLQGFTGPGWALGEPGVAARLGSILMLFILVLMLMERWSRKGKMTYTVGSYKRLPRYSLSRSGSAFSEVNELEGAVTGGEVKTVFGAVPTRDKETKCP